MFDIPSVFPQQMDEKEREILQSNQRHLEARKRKLMINRDLFAHFVHTSVYTVGFEEKAKVC